VVALGKAGSGEMLAGSDLDLMLIYDHAATQTPPTQNFIRLANALTGALTAQGPEGPLYKVDMRLRPSGNQGPVAVSLAAFRRYHESHSWTWERLALTRARVMAATAGFGNIVSQEIVKALSRKTEASGICSDVLAMRDRVGAELPPAGPFDVKYLSGGMLELGFVAEALQLIYGPADPSLFRANTTDALRALATAGHIAAEDASALIAADHLWRTVQGITRITGLTEKETEPPQIMLAPLLRATGTADLEALQQTIAKAAESVRDCFQRYIIAGANI
jgi:glutamate-ammonia-ligase adenylyltransferase